MCYYNGVRVKRDELLNMVQWEQHQQEIIKDLVSGFDYDNYPIITAHKGEWHLDLAHWEFIPYWYKSMKEVAEARKKYTTLNAVGEKLLENRMYKEAALKRRCLVLSSGFYEWRHYKSKTYPYYIKLKDKNLFYMAGIHQFWTDKETGEVLNTFALITTKANELMEQIHNKKKRMPTILTEDLAKEWMCEDLDEQRIQEIATYQIPSDKMEAHTIRKDFREALNPVDEFKYELLPQLELA